MTCAWKSLTLGGLNRWFTGRWHLQCTKYSKAKMIGDAVSHRKAGTNSMGSFVEIVWRFQSLSRYELDSQWEARPVPDWVLGQARSREKIKFSERAKLPLSYGRRWLGRRKEWVISNLPEELFQNPNTLASSPAVLVNIRWEKGRHAGFYKNSLAHSTNFFPPCSASTLAWRETLLWRDPSSWLPGEGKSPQSTAWY